MVEDALVNGVKTALANEMIEDLHYQDIASAISNEAVYTGDGSRQLLALDPTSNELVQYDIKKAIFAAAGVLGATIPLALGSLGIASILAGIGALGALQGLKKSLPRKCAIIVYYLLPDKKMSYKKLREEFYSAYDAPDDIIDFEFKQALEQLEQMGSVSLTENSVCLIERVIVRM